MKVPFFKTVHQLLDRIPVYGPMRVQWRAFRMRKPGWARLARVFVWMVFLFYCIKIVFLIGIFGPVPTVRQLKKINLDQASAVYSADGQLLGRFYARNRTSTDFKSLPPHLIQALVATEDSRFYQHGGVDWLAYVRVLFKTVLGGDESSGGGSTLSQQVAKNLYPRRNFPFMSTPINKLRELLVARRLERAYTKEDILTLYLNTVPFPDNVFGIEVAARRFFSVQPKDLSVVESATLVGTLKGSTYYNPRRFPERAKERRNIVLQLMADNNYLPGIDVATLKNKPVTLRYSTDYMLNEGKAEHFRDYLKIKVLPEILDSIAKTSGKRYDIYSDGLKIYTTLDARMQEHAEVAVATHMKGLQRTFNNHWAGQLPWHNDTILGDAFKQTPRYQAIKHLSEAKIKKIIETKQPITIFTYEGEKDVTMSPIDSFKHYFALLNAGLIAMEPQTGAVKAWVGGYDFDFNQYDQVRARRQTGSIFKPIVYATALAQGISPCEPIPNKRITWHKYDSDWAEKTSGRKDPRPNKDKATGKDLDDWTPENVDKRYGGYYSMEGALAKSVNTATVQTMMRVGAESVVKMAKLMGIESPVPPEPSIALGAAEVQLQEMVSAYACFANRGKKTLPFFITRIEKADGTLIADFKPKPQLQVLKTIYADAMTQMLRAVIDEGGTGGSVRWKYGVETDVAGKTGTSQNHSDGWFVGFIPRLIAGSYVGAPSPAVRFRDIRYGQGSHTALPIWGLFMQRLLNDTAFIALKSGNFAVPSGDMVDSLNCGQRPWPKSTGTTATDTTLIEVLIDSTGKTILGNPDELNLPVLPDLNDLAPEPTKDKPKPEKEKEGEERKQLAIPKQPADKPKTGGGLK